MADDHESGVEEEVEVRCRHPQQTKKKKKTWSDLFRDLYQFQQLTEEQVDEWLDELRVQNTKWPAIVQIVASWMAACVVLIHYCRLYYYSSKSHNNKSSTTRRLPLMTEARGVKFSLSETHAQLVEELQRLLVVSHDEQQPDYTDHRTLIRIIRQHSKLRRLVSRFMKFNDDEARQCDPNLFDALISIYDPHLLQLPTASPRELLSQTYVHDISVIVPCYYKESPEQIQHTLQVLFQHCVDPPRVQLIVVYAIDPQTTGTNSDVGGDDGDSDSNEMDPPPPESYPQRTKSTQQQQDPTTARIHVPCSEQWGDVKLVTYKGGGGRGPTLNFGALCSEGRLLVFVHADCQLPYQWDRCIEHALCQIPIATHASIPHACAFLLGIDTSQTRWRFWRPSSWWLGAFNRPTTMSQQQQQQYPWGIQAIRIMVNIRSWLLKMPYGDQAIAMPALYFCYLGGFPNQPIMEDYDMMDYLRQRSMHFQQTEKLVLIPSMCWCSPRRWQSVGVLYMTIANAVLVCRYATQPSKWTPQRIFEYYYHRPYTIDRAEQQLEHRFSTSSLEYYSPAHAKSE